MSKSLENLFDQSLQLFHAGRMLEARSGYRKILKKIPNHADALHFVGLTYIRTQNYQEGLASIKRAILIKPDHAEAHYNLGNVYSELGHSDEAITEYQQAISIKPDYANAYNNLGNVFNVSKRTDEAIACYQQALLLHPDFSQAYNGLGIAFGEQKNFEAAVDAYQHAIRLKPNFADAHNNLAVARKELGLTELAIESFKNAITFRPDYADAHIALGNILNEQGRFDEAISSYKDALAIRQDVEAAFKLGNALNALNRFDEALPYYELALSINPDFADAHNSLGVALSEVERFEEAFAAYNKALVIEPDHFIALNNLGNTLIDVGQYDRAIDCFKRLLSINHDFADAYNGWGNALNELEQVEDAIVCYQQALAIKPDYVRAIYNFGVVLARLRKFDEALEQYESALSIQPDFTEAQWNRGLIYLLHGQWLNGWHDYKMRWQLKGATQLPVTSYPQWLGDQSIAGKKLLIQFEQGFGDAIQMLRYVNLLEAQGVECWIQSPPQLSKLVSRSFQGAHVLEGNVFSEHLDYRIPVMSLPLAMKTFSEAAIPNSTPYLIADSARIGYWKKQLSSASVATVGLVWRGNSSHKNDRNRSIALAEYIPLILANPLIQFVTLQQDLAAQERDQLKPHNNVRILDKELIDFDETSAVMSALDLVITVDSAPAHLAGALGKPTWILLCFAGEWRWLHERTDSPWYPSATLFRQSNRGNWTEVITQVNHELARLGEVVNEQA
ncbi:tetratricopeptide repeat protein [Methyloradius palustris]|nr:tetratricopeptide repeat protein [Methyloradius palustris]